MSEVRTDAPLLTTQHYGLALSLNKNIGLNNDEVTSSLGREANTFDPRKLGLSRGLDALGIDTDIVTRSRLDEVSGTSSLLQARELEQVSVASSITRTSKGLTPATNEGSHSLKSLFPGLYDRLGQRQESATTTPPSGNQLDLTV
ncbi:MAG: hypothetical protein HQL52_16825 [Magnetococcales bacterium]|nr:hypothetical protein [Magnetococcales bacterium]